MKKTAIAFLSALLIVPTLYAQNSFEAASVSLKGVIEAITSNIIGALSTLFLASAVTVFFMGIVQYIWGVREGNETKVKNGNQFIMWSLIALFVMFSVYGIVKFAQNILFADQIKKGEKLDTIVIPKLKIDTNGGGDTQRESVYKCNSGKPCSRTPGGTLDGICNSQGNACLYP